VEVGKQLSRRTVLRCLGAITAGIATNACTPLRILTRAYPEEFNHDVDKVGRVLRAFVSAVIPGAPEDSADLVRAYSDRAYPFAPYTAFLASDLCRRARGRCGEDGFWALDARQRTELIGEALAADGATRRLYTAAIFLAQVSFYGGIYDDERGCPLIDFAGRYRGDEVSYDGAERFLPASCTPSGNYS
jgi:hypothetical protein